MAWWRRRGTDDDGYGKNDRGAGSLDQFRYDLTPKRSGVRIRLAGSDPHQETLRPLIGAEVWTAGGQRTVEEERSDAPLTVRLFVDRGVTGPVGTVPRGLEGPVLDALNRLERSGKPARIPAEVVSTKHGLRVDLLLGRAVGE